MLRTAVVIFSGSGWRPLPSMTFFFIFVCEMSTIVTVGLGLLHLAIHVCLRHLCSLCSTRVGGVPASASPGGARLAGVGVCSSWGPPGFTPGGIVVPSEGRGPRVAAPIAVLKPHRGGGSEWGVEPAIPFRGSDSLSVLQPTFVGCRDRFYFDVFLRVVTCSRSYAFKR